MEANHIQRQIKGPIAVRRAATLVAGIAVLLWSVSELVNLMLVHTTGAELYGVLAAAIAVGVAGLSLALLLRPSRPTWAVIVVLVLWAIVVVTGIAGTVAHVVGPVPGHGPVDPRPRPIAAPLVFSALGLVGGAALFIGRRAGLRTFGKS